MSDVRHPSEGFFYLLSAVLMTSPTAISQTPPLTVVSDIVYRADGTTASGTLLIS